MNKTCPSCGCEQGAGLLCASETDRLERDLGDVAAIVEDLNVTLSKQARVGNPSGSAGLARERSPINVGAMAAGDNLANVLTTWARDVLNDDEIRRTTSGWGNPSADAAAVLLSNVDHVRRHPAVVELIDEIADAIAQARRVVDRPEDSVFVGPCMNEVPDEECNLITCMEDLYARQGASAVRCKVCGAEHEVAERREWLLEQAKDRLFTVREAAQMVGRVGRIEVTEDRIRGYLRRGRLVYHPIGSGQGILLRDLLKIVVADGQKKSA